MTTLGVLATILLVAIVIAAAKVRGDEKRKLQSVNTQKVIVSPEVEQQIEVIAARARKRRSDFGTKRPRKPLESADINEDGRIV